MTIVIVGWVDRAIELFIASTTNILIRIGRKTAVLCPKCTEIQICGIETVLLCPEYIADN